MSKKDIFRRNYGVLTEEQKTQMNTVKALAETVYEYFETIEPSREMSLAKTYLETSIMWAVKGITTTEEQKSSNQ